MRVDAIWGISKDPEFGDDSPNSDFNGNPEAYGAFIHDHCKMGPYFQEYLRELASVCDECDDKQMVFEFQTFNIQVYFTTKVTFNFDCIHFTTDSIFLI